MEPGTLESKGIGRPDFDGDVSRLWDVMKGGGIAIVPGDFGYELWGGSKSAVRRMNEVKGRGAHKRQGIVMSPAAEREIHEVSEYQRSIIDCITVDYDLPLGIVAPFRSSHPLMQALDPELLDLCTWRGTVATAVNAGKFHVPLGNLSLRERHPIFGTSANLTGKGVKHRLEDVEKELLDIADLVLDYGLRRYHMYNIASTQINFATMELVRYGGCYELISDVLLRHFDWQLPDDPGRDVSPNGHVNEFALTDTAAGAN